MEVVIRPYQPGDAEEVSQVMWRSVREAALADYRLEQTAAWLPEPIGGEAMNRRATDGRKVLVAAGEEGRILGYIDVEADGHIDHFYCLPEAIGTGVASALYDQVEATAARLGIRELRVEASEAARRFFAKRGFVVSARRDFELRGVRMHNYEMNRSFQAQASNPDHALP